MISLFTKQTSYLNFARALGCAWLALTIRADAQTRPPAHIPTDNEVVVFAVSFSPDGSTLAIARGINDPRQRYGKIELWDTTTGTLRHTIKGFDGPVKSISFSPDGQTLVSASCEFRMGTVDFGTSTRVTVAVGQLKWWDAQTGELEHKLTLPRDYSVSLQVTYSPDGKRLAVVESFSVPRFSYEPTPRYDPLDDPLGHNNAREGPRRNRPLMFSDSDLKLLDAQTGEVIFKPVKTASGTSMFSSDGTLVAKESGKDIGLWNVQTGREEHRLTGFKGTPNSLAFSSDGQALAVAVTKYYHEDEGNLIRIIGSSEVQIFDVSTWRMTRQLQNVGVVNSLAFEPGGNILLIGGLIHEQNDAPPGVKLWDLQTGQTANFHTGGEDFSRAVDLLAISRNGRLLAFKSGDVVQVLDTQTWKAKYTFENISDADDQKRSSRLLILNRVTAVGFSPDGNSLFGSIEANGIKSWDPRTGEVRKHIADYKDALSFAKVSANGNEAAGVSSNGTIHLWDLTSGNAIDLDEPGPATSALALSADGQSLAAAYPKRIIVLRTATRELTSSLESNLTNVNQLTFSADGGMLAAADEEGAIAIWNLASGQIVSTRAPAGKVTAMSFAPGSRVLASAAENGRVNLCDLQTGSVSLQVKKHTDTVNAIAFSFDGRLMATGGEDRTVIISETATGKSRYILRGQDSTTSLAFSPDGVLLASGGGNASVVLWEVRTGRLNRILR